MANRRKASRTANLLDWQLRVATGGASLEWRKPTAGELDDADRRIEARLREIGRHDLADARAARRPAERN